MQVKTKYGTLEGVTKQNKGRDIECFYGVPYAKAERFQAPKEYYFGDNYRCDHYGKKAMQNWHGDGWNREQKREEFSEDCLFLNIFTPDVQAKLPVMVEIHGGSFQTGSGENHEGVEILSDHQMVYVSINYRLGVFGYLYLGNVLEGEEYKTSGNNGTLDQLMALKWIHENIALFGGDPKRVTVVGASAGAKSISALMQRPESKEYFNQAILSSGAAQSIRSMETAQVVTDRYLKVLEPKNIQELLTLDGEILTEAQNRYDELQESTCVFGPVADGIVMPLDWKERLESPEFWSGKALIGSNAHELGWYKFNPQFIEEAPKIALGLFGVNAIIAEEDFKQFELQNQKASKDEKKDKWIEILSDYMYRTYSKRLAEQLCSNGATIWQFSFTYPPAFHVMDQTFAFDDRERVKKDLDGKTEALELAGKIQKSYFQFILAGDPNIEEIPRWNPLTNKTKEQMIWDVPCRMEAVSKDHFYENFGKEVFILE